MPYTHPIDASVPLDTERDRMPYIQIEVNTWIVMCEPRYNPVAIIEHVPSTAGISKYLLRKWDLNPARRPLISMHDSVEDANRAFLWDNSNYKTGREDFVDGSGPRDRSAGPQAPKRQAS